MFNGEISIGSGCNKCNESGYFGRIGFFELVKITSSLRKAISENRPITELNATLDDSFTNMRTDGLVKAAAGKTTIEEVLRATQDTDDFGD